MASISVSMLNLPMCMAFASAAKLAPTVGIKSAFWSSLFIVISDSKYCIISTTLGVSLMSRSVIASYGMEGLHYCMALTSLIVLFLLYSKLYKYMVIIPKCVMDGFLAGCVFTVLIG